MLSTFIARRKIVYAAFIASFLTLSIAGIRYSDSPFFVPFRSFVSGSPAPSSGAAAAAPRPSLTSSILRAAGLARLAPVADYSVTTGTTIVVTDVSGNSDTLTVNQATAGSIQFSVPGRTFSMDGGPAVSNSSGAISLTTASSVTVNAGAGDDWILFSGWSGGATLPNVTLNGGSGNDAVQTSGTSIFLANNSFDIDLQNDEATPGIDDINFGGSVQTSGSGWVIARTSRAINISGTVTAENGNIILEANQQGAATTGDFAGITVQGPVHATGAGIVIANGRGGSGNFNYGVYVLAGGSLKGGSIATTTTVVNATGGTGGSRAIGLYVESTGVISSFGGNVGISASAGPGSSSDNYGVMLVWGGTITSGGNGNVTVTGSGGTNSAGANTGVMVSEGSSTITSGGNGQVSVTGTGGAGPSSHGVMLYRNGRILTGGSGTLSITGTAGGTSGSGILADGSDNTSRIASGGGLMTLQGTAAGFPLGYGIRLNKCDVNPSSLANQFFVADTMDLGSTAFIGNAGRTITLHPLTAGRQIFLGWIDNEPALGLGLWGSELNRISSGGTINVGDSNSGRITLLTDVTYSGTANINLTSGAEINFGAMLQVNGDITLTPGSSVLAHHAGVDIQAFVNDVKIASGRTLSLAINGQTVDTEYDQLSTHDGHLDITDVALDLTGTYVPQAGDQFVIVSNDSANAITGTFAGLPEGTIIPNFRGSGRPAQISYVGNDGNDVVITVASLAWFDVNGTSSSEGNTGTKMFTFTVTRNGNPLTTTSVQYATVDDSATSPSDFTAIPPTTLTFLAGETTKTVDVVVNGDTLPEPDEQFYVHLTNPVGAVVGNSWGLGTILNDDSPSTLQFSSSGFYGDESRTAVVVVWRTGDTSGASDVTLNTVPGGTATGGTDCSGNADYVSIVGQNVHFAAGDVFKETSVTLCADTIVDLNETINVELSNPSPPAELGGTTLASVTINDTAAQFRNTQEMNFGVGSASPYPSDIVVSGVPTAVGNVRVTLFDVFIDSPRNLDALLVGPQGQKYVLMADCAGTSLTGWATLTFEDWAPQIMDHNAGFTTGIYKPTTWITPVADFPAPAPAGTYIEPGWIPGGPTLKSTFQGTTANGTWSLYLRYVSTRTAPTPAVNGTIAAGWGIQFFSPTAANVSVSGRVTSAAGTPLRNARVVLDNGSGGRLTVRTNAFGRYSFESVQAGRAYLLNAEARGQTFTPRIITITDTLTDADLVALP